MRPNRPTLLAAALAMPGLAAAQAPDARPAGGAVVAGQASITRTPGRTQIRQDSDRAILEWRSFDVGANHQVDIRQPGAASWSLQRVTGGDPSAIAGRVTSNGGVALVNPAGVLFHQGAQVDVAALIATTSDITNQNFQAGRMVFDGAPRPGARIENRGSISVADQGLAALAGPMVANSGTIRARLGRVALAGGEAFALDLAGDGLLALDVTRQVSTAPSGATALVTQSGSIAAEGGSVVLTARAASGVLETLVNAGGTTAAAQVALRAEGGGLRLDGTLHAPLVEATASGTVRLAPGAAIEAPRGHVTIGAGGESRIGQPRRLSGRTVVEGGATVRAEGGTVIVHAEHHATLSGSLSADRIEVSSRGGLALDGTMRGREVLVDPVALRIVSSLSGASEPAEITAAAIAATTGALTLQAERSIRVEAAVTKPSGPLVLETTDATAGPDGGIRILRGMTIAGDLVLRSAGDITQAASGAALNLGTLEAHSAGGSVRLNAANNSIRALSGGSAASRFDLASRLAMSVDGAIAATDIALETPQTLALFAPIAAHGSLDLYALRGVTQQAAGAGVSAQTLRLDAARGAVSLQGAGNRIARLGDSFVPRGLSLLNQGSLELVGGINAGLISLRVADGDLTQAATSRLIAESLRLDVPDGSVRLDAPLNGIAEVYGFAGEAMLVATEGPLRLAAPLSAPDIALRATGDITQDQGARLAALSLGLDTDGSATLADPQNAVASLGTIRVGGGFSLATGGALDVPGRVTAPGVTLHAGGALTAEGAIVTDRLALTGASVRVAGTGHAFGVLGEGGATGDFSLATTAPLRLDGALAVGGALRLEAAGLALDAPLTATRVTLRASSGDIGQAEAAPITAQSLLAWAPAGEVRLDAALNTVGSLGGQALGGFAWRGAGDAVLDGLAAARLSLIQGGSLVQAPGAAPLLTENLSVQAGGPIDLRAAGNRIPELGAVATPAGLFLATTGALLLTAPVSVAEADLAAPLGMAQLPGAPLEAGLLRASAGAGSVLLENGGNGLPRLGASQAEGEFRLTTGGTLAIEGPVSAGGTLGFQVAQDIGQAATGAGLTAPLLLVRSLFGNVRLEGAGNFIQALGPSGAAGDFALAQQGAAALSLAGPVSAPSLSFRTQSGLEDSAGGGLRGAMLRLDTDGPVRLDAAGQHLVGAIGGRAGALSLALDGALLVAEALDAPGMMAISAASLGILAPVSAGTAQLAATAGDISQTLSGAGLSAGLLNARAESGSVLLDGQGNRVAALGPGGAAVAFALAQEGDAALRLTGPVAAPTIFLRAALGVENLDGGSLAAGLLRLDTPGAVRLGSEQAVERLGGRVGSLSLAASGALLLAEPLEARGALVLSATALHLAAPVVAGSTDLTARAGNITQAAEGAGLTTAGLRLTASGAVALDGAGNEVARLAGASAAGPLALATRGDLALAGPLEGSDLVLRAGGAMRLDAAALRADRAALLSAPGGFTAGATSLLLPRDASVLPVLILDSRQGGLAAIPAGLLADQPGLEPARQATQLADFGPVRAAPGGPAVFDLEAGAAPVFLLLDGAPTLGVLAAGRLGLLGQGGSAFILGVLGGEGGEAAARAVAVAAPQANYLFNNCVMSAATCSGAPPAPPAPPVDPVTPEVPVLPVPPVLPEGPVAAPPPAATPAPLARPAIPPALGAAPWLDRRDPRPGAPGPFLPRRPEEEEAYCSPNSPSASPRSSPAPSESPSIRSGLPAALPSGPPARAPRSCISSGAEILPSPS